MYALDAFLFRYHRSVDLLDNQKPGHNLNTSSSFRPHFATPFSQTIPNLSDTVEMQN